MCAVTRPFASVTFFSPYMMASTSFLTSARAATMVSVCEDFAEWIVVPFMSLISSRSLSVSNVRPSSDTKPQHLKASFSFVLMSVGFSVPMGARKRYPPSTPRPSETFPT